MLRFSRAQIDSIFRRSKAAARKQKIYMINTSISPDLGPSCLQQCRRSCWCLREHLSSLAPTRPSPAGNDFQATPAIVLHRESRSNVSVDQNDFNIRFRQGASCRKNRLNKSIVCPCKDCHQDVYRSLLPFSGNVGSTGF